MGNNETKPESEAPNPDSTTPDTPNSDSPKKEEKVKPPNYSIYQTRKRAKQRKQKATKFPENGVIQG